jgi:hypothetical protein
LLPYDLLLGHLSHLKLRPFLTLRTFLPTHLSGRLSKYLLLLLRRLPIGPLLLLRLRPKDLLRHLLTLFLTAHLPRRLTEDLLLRLLAHLRHLPWLLLPHLGHLSSLRLRSFLTLHLRLSAASLLSRRRAAAVRIAAAVTFTLTKNVLIQTANKQKAKCDRGNKLL